MGESAAADNDMSEATVALGTEFDAACRSVAIGGFLGCCGQTAVDECSHIVATDGTFLNHHVLCGLGASQGVRAF